MKFTSTSSLLYVKRAFLPLSIFLLSFWTGGLLHAQTTCTYTIQMFDSVGDGWNGGVITVVSNGETTTHALTTGASGASTFEVTNGAPITLSWAPGSWAYEVSFNLLNPDGLVLFSASDPIPSGVIYSAIGFCPNCPAPNPNLTIINQITDSTAFVNWFDVALANNYFIEYGPQGFPFGTGITLSTVVSNTTLTGLNPGVAYDVYIASFCGEDSVSVYIGPLSFQTTYTPPNSTGGTCDYTIKLLDSYGDGWNGAKLTVSHNGVNTDYTLLNGTNTTYIFSASINVPIQFSYTAGFYDFEVSYEIYNPDGVLIFSDGPYPQTGNVFATIACPTCPGPLNAWMADVNANNAQVAWSKSAGATGNYLVEYGSMGFTLGTGTQLNIVGSLSQANLTGLQENTWYNAYVTLDCGDEASKPIGPLMFKTLWLKDIGVSDILTPDPSTQCYLSNNETITVLLTNYGQLPQTLFEFYYAVNGQVAPIPVPDDGLFTGVIGNDSTQLIQFETPWDFSKPGIYIIEAWTVLDGDINTANDTFRLELRTAYTKPLKEDFESNTVPEGWTHNGFVYAPFSHGNETYVLGRNLYSGIQTFTLTTDRVGPVYAGDSLYFDYRFVNWYDGTVPTELQGDTRLEVQISSDCEESYQTVMTINSLNHVTSTDMARKFILLDDYDGRPVNIRFIATWGSGDFWFDIDNINVTGCPGSLALFGTIKASSGNASTGSITVEPHAGTPPYSYEWNIGDTSPTVTGLPSGVYEVSVVDANGCTDVASFSVGITGSKEEITAVENILLYPNPSSGKVFLDVALAEAMEVQLRVFNMSGQLVSNAGSFFQKELKEELDLNNQPPGMYILQIVANGRPYYAKLMLTR